MRCKSTLNRLIGRDVAAVVFIRDYLQLQLEPGLLNLYVWPQIIYDGVKLNLGDIGYRDLLCDQIGKQISHANHNNDEITLCLSENTNLVISLRDESQKTPEVAIFQDEEGKIWDVW